MHRLEQQGSIVRSWLQHGSALSVVFWSGWKTELNAVRCLPVCREYRAQRCTLSSGLAEIPGSTLYFVFRFGGDTGLGAVRCILGAVLCLLVWRGYRAECCTLSSILAEIPGSELYVIF